MEAKKILILGGGVVGVELACEFGYSLRGKVIELITRREILQSMPERARRLGR